MISLGPREYWPALLRERFALMARLTQEGRCELIHAAGVGPDAWERLQALAAADAPPIARVPAPRARVRRGGRQVGQRGPGWAPMLERILVELAREPLRLSWLADYVGTSAPQVRRGLDVLAAEQRVERQGLLWALRERGPV
jgi:hypothetical protein